MSDAQPTNQSATSEDFRAVVRAIALSLIGIWVLAVLALLGGATGGAGNGFTLLVITLGGAPLVFFFILPALIYCLWGGPSGPKIAVGLLLAALVAVAVFMAWLATGGPMR